MLWQRRFRTRCFPILSRRTTLVFISSNPAATRDRQHARRTGHACAPRLEPAQRSISVSVMAGRAFPGGWARRLARTSGLIAPFIEARLRCCGKAGASRAEHSPRRQMVAGICRSGTIDAGWFTGHSSQATGDASFTVTSDQPMLCDQFGGHWHRLVRQRRPVRRGNDPPADSKSTLPVKGGSASQHDVLDGSSIPVGNWKTRRRCGATFRFAKPKPSGSRSIPMAGGRTGMDVLSQPISQCQIGSRPCSGARKAGDDHGRRRNGAGANRNSDGV